MDRKFYDSRFNAMKQEAQTWIPTWRDLRDWLNQTRGCFDEQPNQGVKIDHKKILDNTARLDIRIGAAGMTSGMTSPSRPWFKLGLADTSLMNSDPVKEWLFEVETRMMAVFSKSNIYEVLNSIYEELLTFGTASAIIVEDFNTVIRAHNFTIGEYFLGIGADGRVNSFARRYHQTIGQLITEFGEDNVSDRVRDMFKAGKVDDWVVVRQLIEPNDDRVEDKIDFHNKTYRSVQWEEGAQNDQFLRVHGYDDFPVIGPRWDTTTTSDIYGKGPGWDVLGDARGLQKLQRVKYLALDKMSNPPVQKDSTAGEPDLLPGGSTEFSANTPNGGVKAVYQVDPRIREITEAINDSRNQIGRMLYTDLFMMMLESDRRQITAREVVEKHEEKLLMLGPVLESLESELLDPIIDRTFVIMLNLGLIPPIPEEIQGLDVKPEYISILAQAQRMVGTTAIEQVLQFIGSLAAVDPNAMDNVDVDEAIVRYAETVGLPPKIIRSRDIVAAIRKTKQDAASKQQQMQSAMAGAAGAKVLSEAKLGQNSALDVLLNGGAGNGTPGMGINQ